MDENAEFLTLDIEATIDELSETRKERDEFLAEVARLKWELCKIRD